MTSKMVTALNADEFFEALADMRGIARINRHLLKLLVEMDRQMPEAIKKFFLLCLSLGDDGNTRFTMEQDVFCNKWKIKWDSLCKLMESEGSLQKNASAEDFREIIKQGIDYIVKGQAANLVEIRKDLMLDSDIYQATKPFALYQEKGIYYLYATRFFNAKIVIEQSFKQLFSNVVPASEDDIDSCIDQIKNIHIPVKDRQTGEMVPFKVNKEQAEAIVRGQRQNLVVTGGPGTGKTTVVLYILWNLLVQNSNTGDSDSANGLAHDSMLDWNIYLAAPSGKAADRMRESLEKGLSELTEQAKQENPQVFNKLRDLEGVTIHRLLKYSIHQNGFAYNAKDKFGDKSIFVIDEASMIDIDLFAAFLSAIPESARVFILGDPFQLPSVDAGAVLGEILNSGSHDFIVELKESNRFHKDSNIGKLARTVKGFAIGEPVENPVVPTFHEYKDFPTEMPRNFIDFATLGNDLNTKQEEAAIEKLVKHWVCEMAQLPKLALGITVTDSPDKTQEKLRSDIWELSLKKRMLSAERRGPHGVFNLNKAAKKEIKALARKNGISFPESKYFPGQLLILTENQSMYKLYNGDSGIVVFDGNQPFLMLKKSGKFVFYPLAILPEESLETAFAITIHKSQGSEYDHVTVFLPKQEGHPLLNNQILYTGITRAKESVTIIATPETFKAACETVTQRDTGIEL